jgi:hypothetical protein
MRPEGITLAIRGLAGSGKSIVSCFFATGNFDGEGLEAIVTADGHRYLYDRENEISIVSIDLYCVDPQYMNKYPDLKGYHNWDRDRMVEVNRNTIETYKYLIDNGHSAVIIDQPSLNPRDVLPYATIAHENGHIFVNAEPQAPYDYDLLAARAQRDIDRNGIAASNRRWEPIRIHPDSLGRNKK